MKTWKRWSLILLPVAVFAAALYAYDYLETNLPIGTAYTAKILCSSVFVSGRPEADVLEEDLEMAPEYRIEAEVDREGATVAASFFGLFERTAVYREGLGCTVCNGVPAEELRTQTLPANAVSAPPPGGAPWPAGEAIPAADAPLRIDRDRLDRAMDRAFEEIDPERPMRTRAVVVVQQGRIIGERYSQGVTRDTPLLGWSMTKSVNSALVGILVGRQELSLHAPAPVPAWRNEGDPRSNITLDHLLRMTSGLQFSEEYEENLNSDCNAMLFRQRDMADYAASKPLEAPPGEKWSYSSGTANILAGIVRRTVGGTDEKYHAFPHRALFHRIGMRSAVMEPDASGTFVGSSYMYATARDWARFGLLYLNDGLWDGERMLPEGWVDYSRTPTPESPPHEKYGAQFWLNAGGKDRWLPDLPADMYAASGHEGQYVLIIPSRELVVVRLGLSRGPESREILAFVPDLLEALP